jgi:N-glycosylase/DNA lyase
VLHGRILSLKQDSTHLHYRVTWPNVAVTSAGTKSRTKSSSDDDTESLIRHYFNLTPNLTELYERWSSADPNFKKRAPKFTGVRILRQDAWEALVGFICSSNNNIARISQMASYLKSKFTCSN